MKTEETFSMNTTFTNFNSEPSPSINDFSKEGRFAELCPAKKIICIKGKKGTKYCLAECKHHAIICNDEECECNINHEDCSPETKIKPFHDKTFKSKLIGGEIYAKVQEAVVEMQSQISLMEEKMIDQLKCLGLSKKDKDFFLSLEVDYEKIIQQLKEGKQNQDMKFTGSMIKMYQGSKSQDNSRCLAEQMKSSNDMLNQTTANLHKQLRKLERLIPEECMKEVKEFKMLEGSAIIKSSKEQSQMKLMIAELNLVKAQRVFQASVDGFSFEKFHEKCDDKPNLLYLVENEFGFKYGGYSPCPISIKRIEKWQTDESLSSFVFSLDVNKKTKVIKKEKAIKNGHKISTQQALVSFGHNCPCSLVIGANSDKVKELNWIQFYLPGGNSSYQTSQNRPSHLECNGTSQAQCLLKEVQVYQLTLK